MSRTRVVSESVGLAAAATLLGAAFLFGASSAVPPLRAMMVEFIALGGLFLALAYGAPFRRSPLVPVLVALLLVPPLLQFIPLPPALWSALPGRDPAVAIDRFIGGLEWRPLTLQPNASWIGLLALLPAIAMFLIAIQLPGRARIRLLQILVGLGVISVLLGMAQLATRSASLYLFPDSVPGLPSGLFGNRNHQADFLVIASVAAAVLLRIAPRRAVLEKTIYGGLILLFAAGIFASASRSGMALFAFALFVGMFLLFQRYLTRRLLIAGTAACVVVILLLARSPVVLDAISRFSTLTSGSSRYAIWSESLYAVSSYFPFGAGFGTFTDAYRAIEPLDLVGRYYVNHAHNDFLELTLEAGVIGILSAAVLAVVFLGRCWTVLRAKAGDPGAFIARGAIIAILVPVLHSAVDYPLRTMALLVTVAMFAGFLFPAPGERRRPDSNAQGAATAGPKTIRLAVVGALCLLGLGLAGQVGLSRSALARGDANAALAYWPGNAAAAVAAAESERVDGNFENARNLAIRGIRNDALNHDALRVLGLTELARDRPGAGYAAIFLSAGLGWRDPVVQRTVFERGIATGDYAVAARAGDALLRTGADQSAIFLGLHQIYRDPAGRAALLERLSARPGWSARFLETLHPQSIEEGLVYVDFLRQLDEVGVLPKSVDPQAYVKGLLTSGDVDAVVAMWRRIDPQAQGDPRIGVIDGNFARFNGSNDRYAPFGWASVHNPAFIATRQPRSELSQSETLRLESYVGEPTTLLSQLLALPPGDYRLSYAVRPERNGSDFRVELDCLPSGRSLARRAPDISESGDWETIAFDVTVASARCAAQELRIVGDRTPGEGSVAAFDSFVITSVAE
ncbi:O-antigen ligase family protein [Stakelama tenebrarum]|uniref:O-antigen ligase family protein n=1 Tax=Stakelama tenebrarum TaxID=2711215 RepID=A0A6G6Y3X6_9SPHN|nr:O-antigen ligase family protein [Sphingosinithalassobacter tenebrarum]QIG79551.1 O-antigen ligase family protein [Sphingosinithalassobacter tenebrarum]